MPPSLGRIFAILAAIALLIGAVFIITASPQISTTHGRSGT